MAVGAQADRPLGIDGEDTPGVEPALAFLAAARQQPTRRLSGVTVVVGGGNSAMDAARTAVRLGGADHQVHLVYRRTAGQMPADPEEVRAVRAEGVTVHELRAPAAIAARDGRLDLVCQVMRLGAADDSGRPRPEPVVGSTETIVADTIIPAVGQRIVCDFLDESVTATARDDAGHGLGGVWVGGDQRRGPANLVSAMGDGRRAAEAMLRGFGLPAPGTAATRPPLNEAVAPGPGRAAGCAAKAGRASPRPARRFRPGDRRAGRRGGPGRGGPLPRVRPGLRRLRGGLPQPGQLLLHGGPGPPAPGGGAAGRPRRLHHRARRRASASTRPGRRPTWPTSATTAATAPPSAPPPGRPFVDKPRFALDDASWEREDDIHRLERDGDGLRLRHRHRGREQSLTRRNGQLVWANEDAVVELDAATFTVRRVRFLREPARGFTLREAAALAVLLDGVAGPGGDPWLAS